MGNTIIGLGVSLHTTRAEDGAETLVDLDDIFRAFSLYPDAPLLFVPLPEPGTTSTSDAWRARELAERIAGTKRRDGRPLGEVAVCATYKTPAEIAAIAAIAEPLPRWRAAKVEVSEAQMIARQLTVRSPWPPGAILIYVVNGAFPPALLVAVDYLMMSSSPDFSYRRAYLLSVQDEDLGAPRAEPPCAALTYQVATPAWTWTFEPRPIGEYNPYRLPAETMPAPPPPAPPAPSPPPSPIMRTRERVTGAAMGWIINGQFVRESDDGAVFEGKPHRW